MSQGNHTVQKDPTAQIRMLTRIIKGLLVDRKDNEVFVSDTELFSVDDEYTLLTEQVKSNPSARTRIFLEKRDSRAALASKQRIELMDLQDDPNVALLAQLRDPSLLN